MGHKTTTAVRPDWTFKSNVFDDGEVSPAGKLVPQGALGHLGASLLELQRRSPTQRLVLIGHSMGTQILCELIREFPQLRPNAIVFMGGAASVRDFADVIVPHLVQNETCRFYNLTLHPLAEHWEGLSPLYRGSLLTWIDDYFEGSDIRIERTVGRFENFKLSMKVFPDTLRTRVILKTFGYSGRKGVSLADGEVCLREHKDFARPEARFWEPGFWAPSGRDTLLWRIDPEGSMSRPPARPSVRVR
jgi:pimeloyl-ACP methyl ester carboxylesterase